MKPKGLLAKTLPEELDNIINFVEKEPQINVRGIKDLLNPLIKRYKRLNSPELPTNKVDLYQDIKSYCNQCQEAIDENRENSFDNQTGILNRLNKIKEDYSHSLYFDK